MSRDDPRELLFPFVFSVLVMILVSDSDVVLYYIRHVRGNGGGRRVAGERPRAARSLPLRSARDRAGRPLHRVPGGPREGLCRAGGPVLRVRDGSVWSSAAFPWRVLEVATSTCSRRYRGRGAGRSAEPREGDVSQRRTRCDVRSRAVLRGPVAVPGEAARERGRSWTALEAPGAVIMRVASELANLAWPMLTRARRPYALEVVGDPWDVFAPGVVRHPLTAVPASLLPVAASATVRRGAAAAAYVTETALQRRYPLERGHAANLLERVPYPCRKPSEASPGVCFFGRRRARRASPASVRPPTNAPRWRLVFVGSLEQLYKGPDVLLRSFLQSAVGGDCPSSFGWSGTDATRRS